MIVITVARKPLEGTVASNIQAWGVGGLNVDACRFSGVDKDWPMSRQYNPGFMAGGDKKSSQLQCNSENPSRTCGRWPANLILQHAPGCIQKGWARISGVREHTVKIQSDGFIQFNRKPPGYRKVFHTDAEGKEEVEVWECAPDCPIRALDQQSGSTQSQIRVAEGEGEYTDPSREMWRFRRTPGGYTDAGGASRYFKKIGGAS